MCAAKRNKNRNDRSPALPVHERQAIMLGGFRADLVHWIATNPRIALRVMRMVEEALTTPFSGTGKPEPLKFDLGGDWSRRVTDADRIVYTVTHLAIYFSRARGHYR